MAHDVFVSYSKKNRVTADAVCARLEQGGVRCWIAPRDIQPGEPWGAAIVRAIGEARVMVLVLSEAANTSRQIWHEVERAVDKGVTLIPLRIEDVVPSETLEYYISATHWLDALSEPLDTHLDHLLGVVNRILERPADAPAPPPAAVPDSKSPRAPARVRTTRSSGRPWLLPGLLLLLVLAIATFFYATNRGAEGPASAPVAATPDDPLPPGPDTEAPPPDERASATWWLERAARDGSVFYEDEISSLFWVFAWARACEGERARTELDKVITKLVGSEAGFIPPGERSDLYTLLGMAFLRGRCADETESVLAEVTKPDSRAGLWLRVATLWHEEGDLDGLHRCRAALERDAGAADDACNEATVRGTLAHVFGFLGKVDERDRELRAARDALEACVAETPRRYAIRYAVGAIATALVQAQATDAALSLIAEHFAEDPALQERLLGLLAIVGAPHAALARTLRLLETSDDLATCSLEAYAALILTGGFDDDPIPSPALPFVIGELLRAERYAHAAEVVERIEAPATRLPALCEIGIATAQRDGPTAGRPWVERAEAHLDTVEPGAGRDIARAILIRARVAVGDREGAERLAGLLADVPARIAGSSDGEGRSMLIAALATARASLQAWDALEADLKEITAVADRMFLQVMVATALLIGDDPLTAD